MLIVTKTKDPPEVGDDHTAVYMGCIRTLILNRKEYCWSVVPKPPSKLDPCSFMERADKFILGIKTS